MRWENFEQAQWASLIADTGPGLDDAHLRTLFAINESNCAGAWKLMYLLEACRQKRHHSKSKRTDGSLSGGFIQQKGIGRDDCDVWRNYQRDLEVESAAVKAAPSLSVIFPHNYDVRN